ncbi:MAG: flippase-like domain-containing protein [candidate division Zixibacteria bacterium]|nr:flippase-like domain-containing protein [candidate division Zixibacteria bacterium]
MTAYIVRRIFRLMGKGRFRHRWIFGILLALILLVLCFYDLDFSRLWQTLKKIRFTYLIPAFLLGMLKVFFAAMRWKMLIDKRKIISVRRIYSVYSFGQLVNISLPALTGQAARVVILNKTENLPKTFGATTVLMEATFDGVCLILLLAISSFFFTFPGWIARYVFIIGLVLLGLIIAYILILINRRGLTYFGKKKIRRKFPRFYKKLEKLARSFSSGIESLTSFRHIAIVFMYSCLMWICSVGVVIFLIAAFDEAFGLEVPYWMAMILVAITAFFTTVPITPGNVGTFQWIVIGILKQVYGGDVSKEVAVGFSIILHFLNLLPVWVTGLFFLFRDHFGVKEIRKESLEEEFPDTNGHPDGNDSGHGVDSDAEKDHKAKSA